MFLPSSLWDLLQGLGIELLSNTCLSFSIHVFRIFIGQFDFDFFYLFRPYVVALPYDWSIITMLILINIWYDYSNFLFTRDEGAPLFIVFFFFCAHTLSKAVFLKKLFVPESKFLFVLKYFLFWILGRETNHKAVVICFFRLTVKS